MPAGWAPPRDASSPIFPTTSQRPCCSLAWPRPESPRRDGRRSFRSLNSLPSPGRSNRLLASAQTLDKIVQADLTLAAQALGLQDRLNAAEARIQIAIDDDVVVLGPMAHFIGRLGHAARHLFLAVLGSGAQTTLEFAGRWRQDEDADQIFGRPLSELLGPLPIDVEEHIVPRGQRRLDG